MSGIIELESVERAYGRPRVLACAGVTLRIDEGELVAIVGPSGSGKSTLLKTMFREILPTDGQILIDGVNVLKIHDSRIYELRRRLGIVFQDFRLIANKTVRLRKRKAEAA